MIWRTSQPKLALRENGKVGGCRLLTNRLLKPTRQKITWEVVPYSVSPLTKVATNSKISTVSSILLVGGIGVTRAERDCPVSTWPCSPFGNIAPKLVQGAA